MNFHYVGSKVKILEATSKSLLKLPHWVCGRVGTILSLNTVQGYTIAKVEVENQEGEGKIYLIPVHYLQIIE